MGLLSSPSTPLSLSTDQNPPEGSTSPSATRRTTCITGLDPSVCLRVCLTSAEPLSSLCHHFTGADMLTIPLDSRALSPQAPEPSFEVSQEPVLVAVAPVRGADAPATSGDRVG